MNAKKRSTKKLTIKESYSDIWSDNAWDAYDIALEYLGAEGLCEALAKAMGTDALADNLKYIFRTNEIPFEEDDEDEDDEEYDESLKRPVKEAIDLDADGYKYVSGRPGYHLYRKDIRGENGKVVSAVWAAQKYDAMKGQTVGDPFEITYDQARGFEPIEDTVASRLSKKVGKALGFPIRREALYNRFSDPSYNDDVATFFFDNRDEIKKIAAKNGFGWIYNPFKGRDGDNLVDVEGTSRSDINAFEKDLRRFVKKFGIDFNIQELANTKMPLGSIRINFYK